MLAINPNIMFGAVTEQSNKDFNQEDLGKTLQESAPNNAFISKLGQFISKITLESALLVGILLTIILIFGIVIPTSHK